MTYEYNNAYNTLPQKQPCPTCENDMKLEAKEDTKGDVTYVYECKFHKCKKVFTLDELANM